MWTTSCCSATRLSCATTRSACRSNARLPFFEALGDAVGSGRVTIVPGNHDHRLIAPRLKGRRQLGLEQRYDVAPGDPLDAVVRCMGRARVELVYPGVWLRPDVYATHGHYLDCH